MDPVMTNLLPRILVLPMGAASPYDRTVHFSFILDTTRCASRPALQIGLSTVDAFSVPRSKHPRPADARSPSEVRFAPFRFRTPPTKASLGPLPENFFSRLGSGSRRHTLRASMYRTQREIPKYRSQHNVQSHNPHRPHRSKR